MMFSNQQLIGLGAVAALGVWYVSSKAGEAVDAINPTNQDNVFNQAAIGIGEAVTGNPNATQNAFDYLYASIDLVNPFNDSDVYARQVWGLDG